MASCAQSATMEEGTMDEIPKLLMFLVGYILLMRWILPRLGVPT